MDNIALRAQLAGDNRLNSFYTGIKVLKRDKSGCHYLVSDCDKYLVKLINVSKTYFKERGKHMTDEIDQASLQIDEALEKFKERLNKFNSLEQTFSSNAKKVASDIKIAQERLNQGLTRIDKAANFDKLERYVLLIERAAEGMERLAELEKTGKLEKIIDALK